MNKVILKGNLVRDPDVKVVNVGEKQTSVVNFTLAVSRFFRKNDGTRNKDTTFVLCEAWDTGAETIGQYLVKGSPLLLEGSLKSDSWTNSEGKTHSRLKVRVLNFEMLGDRRKKDEDTPEPPTDEPDKDPETPF